jgi:hypothetical protein
MASAWRSTVILGPAEGRDRVAIGQSPGRHALSLNLCSSVQRTMPRDASRPRHSFESGYVSGVYDSVTTGRRTMKLARTNHGDGSAMSLDDAVRNGETEAYPLADILGSSVRLQ